MKKIPTLFERVFENNKIVGIEDSYDPKFQWIFDGEGLATIKWDGSACAIIAGKFYKRFDAKNGKPIPEGAIKCQPEADPVTGHLPCWVECDRKNKADKWFWEAYDNTKLDDISPMNWTFEAIGKHFQGNPYGLDYDILVPHGQDILEVDRSFEGIKAYLRVHNIEGIVFWKDDKPQCKIKASDFGYHWKEMAYMYEQYLISSYAKEKYYANRDLPEV